MDGKFGYKVKNNVFTYIYAVYNAHIASLGCMYYHYDSETSNISHTLVSNKIVGHPDVVGAPSVAAAQSIFSFSI